MAPVPIENPTTALPSSDGLRGSLTTIATNMMLNDRIASITIAMPSVTPGPGTMADIFTSGGVSLTNQSIRLQSINYHHSESAKPMPRRRRSQRWPGWPKLPPILSKTKIIRQNNLFYLQNLLCRLNCTQGFDGGETP